MRVLIVEDDPDVRSGLLDAMRMSGVDASAVADAETALQRIASDSEITVVLTDMYMPVTDGLELAARARQMRPDAIALEVVMLSGGSSFSILDHAEQPSIFAVLRKPAQVRPILAALQNAHLAACARRQHA